MPRKRINKSPADLNGIEKLLNQQTTVILSAVDEKIAAVDEKIARLEKRIGKLEIKVDQRFDQLITTLDKFLKRLKDMEESYQGKIRS